VLTPQILEVLRANPGRWAVVREYSSASAVKHCAEVRHPPDIELRATVEEP
jgi:hypothetical protein